MGAGIELSEYVMPGLGGRKLSQKHVEETARVLNEIDPAFIRMRSLQVYEIMPLWQKIQSGEFELLREDEVVAEIGAFIERLDCHSVIKSDHMMNILMEVEGKLPQDKEKMLAIIKRYLNLPLEERLNFQLGRRMGYYERLEELRDAGKHEKVEQVLKRIEAEIPGGVEEALRTLKTGFI